MDRREYVCNQMYKQHDLLRKGSWTDADKLEYMELNIAPYSRYWRMGMKKALKHAIRLLREEEDKADRKTEPLKGSERLLKGKTEPQKWETPPKFEHKGIQTACVSVPMALIEDEPQTNADQHVQRVESVESVEPTWTKEEHEAFYTFLWNVINPNEMQDYIEMFETNDEPQTERSE